MKMQHIAVVLLIAYLSAASAIKLPEHVDYLEALDYQADASRARIPPTCTPFYPSMISGQPKGSTDPIPAVYGVCVNLHTGNFVAVGLAVLPSFYIYSESGVKIKKVPYPAPNGVKGDCVFTKDNIYITDVTFNKILKYTADGTPQGEFAIGAKFFRLTYGGDYLYATILATKLVHVYNMKTHARELTFEITSPIIRGIAMDTKKILHITTLSKVVEKYTFDGHKIGQIAYPDLIYGDGIAIDGSDNIIIADHASKVVIYNQNNILIKRLYPIAAPVDVAVSANCQYLYVSATGLAKVLIF